MLRIRLICVGAYKEAYFAQACHEYTKRLGRFCSLSVIEIAEKDVQKEALEIQKHLKGFVIACDLQGQQMDSVQFAQKIDTLACTNSELSFVIGGSNGLHSSITSAAHMRLCFSPMTFPHHLAKVFLLEQLYRAFCILEGKTYHK